MQVIIMITLLVLFLSFMILPGTVLQAAQIGLNLWWNTLIPSLLPFFILNELLMLTGSLRLCGFLFQKPLQKLFHLPGETALVFLAGYATGAPLSAGLVGNLRKNRVITRRQANILLPATANTSPGFLLAAVAATMLQNPVWGRFLLFTCYGSNLLLALILLCRNRIKERTDFTATVILQGSPKHRFTMEDFRQGVFRSCRTMVFIGVIVMLCYILMGFFTATGLPALLSQKLPNPWGELVTPLFSGITEITAGSQLLSATDIPLKLKLPLLAGVLAFGGLSAALQIKNEIRNTDISIGFYLLYKIIQGAVAFTLSLLIAPSAIPVWTGNPAKNTVLRDINPVSGWFLGLYLVLSFLSLLWCFLWRFLWDGEHR